VVLKFIFQCKIMHFFTDCNCRDVRIYRYIMPLIVSMKTYTFIQYKFLFYFFIVNQNVSENYNLLHTISNFSRFAPTFIQYKLRI